MRLSTSTYGRRVPWMHNKNTKYTFPIQFYSCCCLTNPEETILFFLLNNIFRFIHHCLSTAVRACEIWQQWAASMVVRCLDLLWYEDDVLKKSEVDLRNVNSWESLRREAGHLTSFTGAKLKRLRFQTRDGVDLEENFIESNYFKEIGNMCHEILLIDPQNQRPSHGPFSDSSED